MKTLRTRIQNKKATLGIVGLGYVGLPVAAVFAREGFRVIGVDINQSRVETIRKGECPIEGREPGLAKLLEQVVGEGQFEATSEYSYLANADVILIAVETPIEDDHIPQYRALRAAISSLGRVMKIGTLIIVESTIAPGTMRSTVLPLIEEHSGLVVNKEFYLGHCPERVMPGKLLHNIRNVSRVVGGSTPETAQTMIDLYRHIVDAELDAVDLVTAEIVKTAENAYRDVNIAFANELALICEAVGGDVWKIRKLINKSPGRYVLYPGAGVGGHCIPKDPWLLVYGVKNKEDLVRLIPISRAINDAMPAHVLDLARETLKSVGTSLVGTKILVLGYAYLENSDDDRNSPSRKLTELAQNEGAEVIIHDPYIRNYDGNFYELAEGCSCAIIMVKHPDYQELDVDVLANRLLKPIIIDGRNTFEGEPSSATNLIYRLIGVKP